MTRYSCLNNRSSYLPNDVSDVRNNSSGLINELSNHERESIGLMNRLFNLTGDASGVKSDSSYRMNASSRLIDRA